MKRCEGVLPARERARAKAGCEQVFRLRELTVGLPIPVDRGDSGIPIGWGWQCGCLSPSRYGGASAAAFHRTSLGTAAEVILADHSPPVITSLQAF